MTKCTGRTIAQSPVATVDRCTHCGSLSLHVGPVTLRLEEHAFRRLVSTLAEAVRRLEEDDASTPTATAPGGSA
jgi:hypothetical protein